MLCITALLSDGLSSTVAHILWLLICVIQLCLLAGNDVGMWSSYQTLHRAEYLRHIKLTKDKAVSYYITFLCLSLYWCHGLRIPGCSVHQMSLLQFKIRTILHKILLDLSLWSTQTSNRQV